MKPIIGLSPMDGVTDAACRAITARYGAPDVTFTEFTTATGLFYAPDKIIGGLEYTEIERPVVAQIFGQNPDDFYRATHVVCELGFDGIDINMGCPAKKIANQNCGAKLITLPTLALQIIRATQAAIQDWSHGQTLEELKISEELITLVNRMNEKRGSREKTMRRLIPYSVKTRIGFDTIVIEQWIETLLSEHPAAISIHGRTLKQMYRGSASWEAIRQAVPIAKGSGTLILGNGDLDSLEEAIRRIEQTGVDGVLIGRSAIGNPWIFKNREASREERLEVALEHARYYQEIRQGNHFEGVKKHLSGYLRNISGAAALRSMAMKAQNLDELCRLLQVTPSIVQTSPENDPSDRSVLAALSLSSPAHRGEKSFLLKYPIAPHKA
ncbi:MAG: tRNA-dihydrouridine synthase [Deltaproteobacteria bacterium]|nr:tRNA-dihydrouridine synthase [Deltaproteobacteria bacterium]